MPVNDMMVSGKGQNRCWEQTEPAEFEIDPQARRRYLVALDPDLLKRVRRIAQSRGLATESLVNLLLEQRLQEVESQVA